MQRRSGRAGFTLVEMMISLVIIGVMAMIIAPSLSEMLGSGRQTAAAMDLVRFGRKVRAQALATGVAHLLRYRGAGNGSSNDLGRIDVHMGMNSKCQETPWGLTFVAGAAANHLAPRESDAFNMFVYNPTNIPGSGVTWTEPRASDTSRQVIRLQARIGADESTGLLLCYQPNGEIFAANAATDAAAAALTPQTLPVTFRITRRTGGVAFGRVRQVIFPPGGSARSL